MNKAVLEDAFRRAMELNRSTFEGEEYDAAYHALMAALHCGQSLENVDFVRNVGEVAAAQLAYIDQNRPEYEHSSTSARARGRSSVFEMAYQVAKARVTIIETKARARN